MPKKTKNDANKKINICYYQGCRCWITHSTNYCTYEFSAPGLNALEFLSNFFADGWEEYQTSTESQTW